MQKPTVGLIVVIMSLGTIDFANATYVIRLKNGNEYVTTRYWQEGTQILFDTYGGIFGVDRAFVGGIEKSDKMIRLAPVAEQVPRETIQGEATKGTSDIETPPPDVKKTEPSPDDPIIAEFNRLKQASKEVDSLLTPEIRTLLGEITAFKNKLSKDSQLFFKYPREFNDANEISSVVEDALRARTN